MVLFTSPPTHDTIPFTVQYNCRFSITTQRCSAFGHWWTCQCQCQCQCHDHYVFIDVTSVIPIQSAIDLIGHLAGNADTHTHTHTPDRHPTFRTIDRQMQSTHHEASSRLAPAFASLCGTRPTQQHCFRLILVGTPHTVVEPRHD
jgi:hypothetical protein